MLSMHARLLLAASLVLVAFLGATGWALERAFRESLLAAVQERLQAQVYMLLGAVEWHDGQLRLPAALPEPRLATPGSGLYAQVTEAGGRPLWRSSSALGIALPPVPAETTPGTAQFRPAVGAEPLFALTFAVDWEVAPERYQRYVFQVVEEQRHYAAQVSRFQRHLWLWLLAATGGLLLVQGIILRWSLHPLRRVAADIKAVEAGAMLELTGRYPRELQPLTGNLNALIRHSRSQLERYRHALGDLAHSLKTPLAVLRGVLEGPAPADTLETTLQQQLQRMQQTVDYQLQRAAAAGRQALAAPLPVLPVANKVLNALAKVYADKAIQMACRIDSTVVFYGDEGDLMELLGNLADNACKWCRQQVRVHGSSRQTAAGVETLLEIEDDGPGIPVEQRRSILERGQRADPTVAGHGIGLAIVRDMVEEVYDGRLELGDAALGGARVRVLLRAPRCAGDQ